MHRFGMLCALSLHDVTEPDINSDSFFAQRRYWTQFTACQEMRRFADVLQAIATVY
jgi:hypothetical protein